MSKFRYIEVSIHRNIEFSTYRSFDMLKYRSFDISNVFCPPSSGIPVFRMQILNESFDVYVKCRNRTYRLVFLFIDIVSSFILVRYPTQVRKVWGFKCEANPPRLGSKWLKLQWSRCPISEKSLGVQKPSQPPPQQRLRAVSMLKLLQTPFSN